MAESIIPQHSYSLKVELSMAEGSDSYAYLFLTVKQDTCTETQRIPIRLDLMYEQIQVIVDNHLRQLTNKLSATMREARKLSKGQ